MFCKLFSPQLLVLLHGEPAAAAQGKSFFPENVPKGGPPRPPSDGELLRCATPHGGSVSPPHVSAACGAGMNVGNAAAASANAGLMSAEQGVQHQSNPAQQQPPPQPQPQPQPQPPPPANSEERKGMTLGEFELQKLQVDKFDWREIRVHFEHIVLEQLLVGKQKFNLFLIPDVLRMLLQQVFAGLCAAELLYDEVDVELGVGGVFAGADAAGGGVRGAGVAGEGVAAAAEEEDHRAGSFAGFGAPSAAAGQPHARAVGGDAAAAGGETGRTREQLAHGGGGDLPEDPHSVFWDPAGELDEGGNVADGRASRGSAHVFSSRPRQHQQESASTFQRHRRRRALSTQCVLDSEEAASWAAFLEEWEQKSPPLKRALRSLYEDYQTDLWFWFVLTTSTVVAVFAFFFLFLLVLIVEKVLTIRKRLRETRWEREYLEDMLLEDGEEEDHEEGNHFHGAHDRPPPRHHDHYHPMKQGLELENHADGEDEEDEHTIVRRRTETEDSDSEVVLLDHGANGTRREAKPLVLLDADHGRGRAFSKNRRERDRDRDADRFPRGEEVLVRPPSPKKSNRSFVPPRSPHDAVD